MTWCLILAVEVEFKHCCGKIGSKNVVAVDLDSNAVEVAKKNIVLNNVQSEVKAYKGNLLDKISDKANMVVSNIIADIIISLSQSVFDYLKTEGIFIASGIIKDRINEVKDAIESNGFDILEILEEGEWCSVAAKKRS